ncbi:transcription-repair coupling factor [Sulfurospirillum arcachonense]|uniref:transcription-repair coupling factor n=1 Tax=Sulfurospirillum arcachonense TaxID=57666 RepID=UPI00046AC68F|nr:transcription-repair coupling factor [Sulfurospirillum arcachonense]
MQSCVYEFFKNGGNTDIIGVANEKDAFSVSHAVQLTGKNVYILPDLRASFGDDLLSFNEEIHSLLTSLKKYYEDKSTKKVLIIPIRTLFTPLPPEHLFDSQTIEFGDSLEFTLFKEQMLNWGYSVVDVVESPGEVSFRGDIIDIFPIDSKYAIRISFFDDTVESIRFFECETQKSQKEELESISISPALFSLNNQEYDEISEKIEKIDSDSFVKDIHSLGLWAIKDICKDYFEEFDISLLPDLEEEIEELSLFNTEANERLKSLKILPQAKEFKPLEIASLKTFLDFHKDKKITILAKSEILLRQEEIDLNFGFKQSDLIVNIISAKEVIVSLNKTTKKRRRKKASMILDELKIGDLVVHENYGVGLFKGLQNTTVLGSTRDFVVVQYQGEDKLLLPVENLDVIDRYISDGGHLAIVDKLGKGSFQKLKAKTREKLLEIASEIIAVAAKREMIEATALHKQAKIKEFQKDAGFEYTDDQKKSINEIFSDLKSSKMMDRLLSGDVGFGKTEVAMNAMFLAAINGFQSILLAPTTLLSAQHFKSLYERFKKYGIRVEKLDRFTSTKAKSRIIAELKSGELKVCVGTHSLLGVEMKNPALIVLDEEHKFGVKQKEKLKQMRENVHILSMSATPIPRSLNMALSSIKQYSQILTAPMDREDIRTFVKEYDDKSLKEAISRELRRGGQIFFVHNRIASIENKKKELQELMPGLKILVLHSKISAAVTEKEMMHFEEKEYDLLLSTSIIESGIHIPNVNTIIIDGSENFGIADLHQMRGRVGRSKRQGYCYFLVKDKAKLTEQSKKRLIALEANSYLGSGSVLAYHDLEIRGGGNLIGEAQSGHIKNIGYALYLKMLEDAINTLLNNTPVAKKEVEIKLSVSAFVSSDYVSEDRVRLELYRRLSKCENVRAVLDIEEEMVDRFGKLDIYTKQFLDIITIKILSSLANIVSISNFGQNITLKDINEKKEHLKSRSKDDDDIIDTVLEYLRKRR